MLSTIRYLVIILEVIALAVVGIVAVGNLAYGLPDGVYNTVNACMAISGFVAAVFIALLSITEVLRKNSSNVIVLVEVLWVAFLWIISALEASYVSIVKLVDCGKTYVVDDGWDMCMAHAVVMPICWVVVFLLAMHMVMLFVVIEAARTKAILSLPDSSGARPSPASTNGRFWVAFVRPEIDLLKPILFESVYRLFKKHEEEARTPVKPRLMVIPDIQVSFANRVSRAFGRKSADIEDREKLRWDDSNASQDEIWTGSYYFQAVHPNDSQTSLTPPRPVATSTPKYDSLPRYTLRDEPAYRSSPLKPKQEKSRNDRVVVPPRRTMSRLYNVPSSPIPPEESSMPSRVRRSRTVPTRPSIPHAQPPPRPTAVYRSNTVGARRVHVPSRYKDLPSINFEVPRSHPPRPPHGFLPTPNGRYWV